MGKKGPSKEDEGNLHGAEPDFFNGNTIEYSS